MTDILTAITSFAVFVYRERSSAHHAAPDWFSSFFSSDPILKEAQLTSWLAPTVYEKQKEIVDLLLAEPEFAIIAPRDHELDPMVLHPGGGARISPPMLILSLFSSAFLIMYYLRLPSDEGTFVRTVLEGFEELRRALRGEKIRAYSFTGIGILSLSDGKQISTPWGFIRSAPKVGREHQFFGFRQPTTSCILAESRLIPVEFHRDPSPQPSFDSAYKPNRCVYLLPLACALASADTANPVAPLILWSSLVTPFQQGSAYSFSVFAPGFRQEVNFTQRVEDTEEWARILEQAHVPTIDIAAKRLVSAIAHRSDKSDSLIDAVMAWENLLGTSNEVTFRVSASLAKLLEADVLKRKALRKSISAIYDIRSRLVHGAAIDPLEIDKSCTQAIDIAVQAMRASYKKGKSWLNLSSNERSDSILLEG